ncbi:hypothetical protein C8F01DRAFT_1379621 [Mycena amicta]|nr:hypothetical protein C8F01DRAFT_1379621 [Mycena amicta]
MNPTLGRSGAQPSLVSVTQYGRSAGFEVTYLSDEQQPNPTRVPTKLQSAALKVQATERYGLDAEGDWESLMPSGHGFIRLGEGGQPFEPAIYHQLHCLSVLRRRFISSDDGTTSQNKTAWHVHHCMNYLRQAILCNADTTLEPSYLFHLDGRNGTVPAASGMDVVHECQDWTQLRQFVEENQKRFRGVPFAVN